MSFFSCDIAACLAKAYKKFPALYRATFWTTFIVLNIVFAFHTVHFITGNHEWPFIRESMAWNRFWYEGRITEALPYSLFGFQLLPIALNLFDFFGLSLSVTALAYFLKIPKNKFCFFGFCLPIALLPYNLCWLFHNAQGVFYYGSFFIVLALTWIEAIYQKRQLFLKYIFPIFVLLFVLGFHAAFIEVAFILIISHILIRFLLGEKFKSLFYLMIVLFLNVLLAAVLLKGAISLIDKFGYLSSNFYNVQMVNMKDIYSHFVEVIPYVFKQFGVTYPFLDGKFLSLFFGICVFSSIFVLIKAFKEHSYKGIFVIFMGLLCILFLTQLSTLISDNAHKIQFWVRLNGFFGVQFMFIFFWAFLFQNQTPIFLKNIIFLLVILLMGINIQKDMYAMRVWKQGLDAENKQLDHIMTRIESTPGFSYSKKYSIAQVGDFSLRRNYYEGQYKNNDVTLLGWSYRANWLNYHVYNFNAPYHFVSSDLTNQNDKIFRMLDSKDMDFVLKEAKVWPDQKSVYVSSRNLILVFIEENDLRNMKQQLMNYISKNDGYLHKQSEIETLNELLKHPSWGPDKLIRIQKDRLYHERYGNYATLLSYTDKSIVLDWDCCGREEFIKNDEGIYEFKSR